MASYELINYSTRPAKYVERGMIVDVLRRLDRIQPLKSYGYVGFGSPFFTDFKLVHRELGIRKMTSIEEDKHKAARFRFNKPFRCVTLEFGHSNAVLPTLQWDRPCVTWLDYDGRLDTTVLADIDFVVASLPTKSVFLLTVSVHPDERGTRISELTRRLTETNIPYGTELKEEKLGPAASAAITYEVIETRIRKAVDTRGGSAKDVAFHQMFHFRYSDGARMMTVGGLLLEGDDRGLEKRLTLSDFHYVRSAAEAYKLEVPVLTPRELIALDRQLPAKRPRAPHLREVDRKSYAELYRYFPRFVDADF